MSKKYLNDVCDEICRRTTFRKDDVWQVVRLVFPIMVEYMMDDDEVTIKDFGNFRLLKRAPRMCYSARNQKYTMTDYKAVIKFKQSVRFGRKLAILTNPEYDWEEDNSVEDE